VTAVAIDPATVVLTGQADQLATVQRITLPAVDLSSSRSTVSFQVQIPYPAGMDGPVKVARSPTRSRRIRTPRRALGAKTRPKL